MRVQFCILFSLLFSVKLFSQEISISGIVFDKNTRQTLSSVSVLDKKSSRGTISDGAGSFKISLPVGDRSIEFSYVGYEVKDTVITISGNTEILVYLNPHALAVEEVTIIADKLKDHVTSPLMGAFTLSKKEMLQLPSLLGEADPLKFLQLTPGVKSASYGGAGIYVRGGGTDQNLILYDNTIVYSPGHLLGIFSVFNPDIIKEVSIIKSGIPAQYGGKLSSVVKLNSSKGNKDSLEVSGSVGLISSRLSISGPLFKNKGSFIIGGRQTYLGLIVKPIIKQSVNSTSFLSKESIYNFYDFNLGAAVKISRNDQISISAYQGMDKYRMGQAGIKQENYLKWGNRMASLLWDHRFNDRNNWNTNISWTKYEFGLSGSQADYFFGIFSSIEDFSFKSELNLKNKMGQMVTGFELIDHSFIPNRITANAGNFDLKFGQFGAMNAFEGGVYFNDEISISSRLSVAAGLRLSFFNHHGPYREYVRDALGQITDTLYHQKGESLASFANPEPRIVFKYQMNSSASFKASYMRIAQYIHLATSSSASLPTDIWIPSTSSIKPLIGDQLSIGFFKKIAESGIDFSTELYYKKMKNKLEFLRGVMNISIDGNLNDNLAIGIAQSYGIEFYLAKNIGKYTGWLSYTLSRTEQRFDEINSGFFYPAKYDGRHDVSLTLVRKFNEKWSGSVVFIYISGNAFTMPVGRYIIQGTVVNQYGGVNSFRMPPNHRMDASLSRKIKHRKNWDSELTLSIYNIYNRANPYFIYYEVVGNIEKYSLQVNALEVTLLPIIPSLSWNFKF